MPKLEFGEKAHFDGGSNFLKLDVKGEKVHLRILGSPYYDGKHFVKNEDGKFDVSYCPRIMNQEKCEFCEVYFGAKAELKKLPDEKKMTQEDLFKKDELTEMARANSVAINFYYPVLDREDGKAKIFQTKLSVRNKLDQEIDDGVDVLKFDYKVTRTEKPGTDYYTLNRMDSSDTKALTAEEKKEIEKAKGWNLEEMVSPSKESSQEIEPSGKENIEPTEIDKALQEK